MTNKELMLAEKIYDPSDIELSEIRLETHRLMQQYNNTLENDPIRPELLKKIFKIDKVDFYIQGPITFDYGCFTSIGTNTFINYNLTVLDCAPVKIGKDVFMGPNISIYTPVHPLRYQDRNCFINERGVKSDKEYAKAITIEDNCWIAGNVVICGGVTIGEGSVIGAGSVVTRSIPPHSLAVGNPCKVIRKITEDDSLENHPELF